MGNVYKFPGRELVIGHGNDDTEPGQANGALVEMLRSLLERAEAGEVWAVAYASCNTDGTVGTAWENPDFLHFSTGAAVAQLFFRFNAHMLGDTE